MFDKTLARHNEKLKTFNHFSLVSQSSDSLRNHLSRMFQVVVEMVSWILI